MVRAALSNLGRCPDCSGSGRRVVVLTGTSFVSRLPVLTRTYEVAPLTSS